MKVELPTSSATLTDIETNTQNAADRLLSAGAVEAADLLASILAKLPTVGQQAAAASISVTPDSGNANWPASGLAKEAGGNLAAVSTTIGATNGAALDADGTGTLQQYLRGILKAFLARIPTVGTQLTAASLPVNDSSSGYLGATISADTGAVEGRLDCTALGNATYPKTVVVHARSADMYLAQGGAAVALNGTAANNFILRAESVVEIRIESAASAYFAHKQVTGAGTLAVTRIDTPIS